MSVHRNIGIGSCTSAQAEQLVQQHCKLFMAAGPHTFRGDKSTGVPTHLYNAPHQPFDSSYTSLSPSFTTERRNSYQFAGARPYGQSSCDPFGLKDL